MIPPTGSLTRQERIRWSREFRDLARRGERRSTEMFVVFAAPKRDGAALARLGITVSRQVGNAVVRNRVKRRIREWYRTEGRAHGRGLDLLVIARPPAAGLDTRALASELTRLVGAMP